MTPTRIVRNISILLSIAVLLTAVVMIGCKENPPAGAPEGAADFDVINNIVIARVGEQDIMMSQLVLSAASFWQLQQNLIRTEIYSQEGKKRGVFPTDEEIEKKLDEILTQQGGRERFLASIPESIPPEYALADFRNTALVQLLTDNILNDEYLKVEGVPTEEEIGAFWNEYGNSLKPSIANERGVPEDQVTIDMARDMIAEQLKNRWTGEHNATLMDGLVENAQVENFLLEKFKQPETEAIEVPEVTSTPEPEEGLTPPVGGEGETAGESGE